MVYLNSIDEWYPFNIPCLELSSLLTAVNTLSFKQESITKIECFVNFSYKAIKFICSRHFWVRGTVTVFINIQYTMEM